MHRDRVIENIGIGALLNQQNVLPRYVQAGITEEQVGRVEVGMKEQPLVGYVKPALQLNFLR